MKKIVGIVVAVVLVVVVGAGIYFYFALSSLVKAGIETYAPRITQTPVTVGSVSASLLGGSLTINDLAVGNPSGFKSKDALQLQKASVTVDPGSVFSDVVHVKDIEIASPHVTYEPGQGSNNLSVLQRNIARTSQADTGQGTPQPQQQSGTPKKLIIDHLLVSGAQASLAVPQVAGAAALVGQESSTSVTLPDIDMRDLGAKEGGLPPAKIAEEVMARLQQQAEQAVKANAQKLIDTIGKGAGNAIDQAPGTAGNVGNQLKGLLGR
jgi:uncharacterized protein involved in outer membrane biogenesis